MTNKKIIALIILILCCLSGFKKEEEKHINIDQYKRMEEKIFEAINNEIEGGRQKGGTIAESDFLIRNGYLNASDLIDESGNTCKGYGLSENNYDKKCIEVFVECPDYKTEGYGKWPNVDANCQNIREYNSDEIEISSINLKPGKFDSKEILEFETYRHSKAKLYYYNLSKVEITDNTNATYNLKELLSENKLSMEGLKVYLESQAKEEKLTKQILNDGTPDDGTRVYRNDSYTIIMCNNSYWFEDVYIGSSEMSFYSKFGNRQICE